MRGNFRDWLRFCVCLRLVQHTRTVTLQLNGPESERLQVREVTDGRRCAFWGPLLSTGLGAERAARGAVEVDLDC